MLVMANNKEQAVLLLKQEMKRQAYVPKLFKYNEMYIKKYEPDVDKYVESYTIDELPVEVTTDDRVPKVISTDGWIN
jgi:hypothetical protein